MQPDSIIPAARIVSFAFNEDMVHFQLNPRGVPILRPKRHDSVKPIIFEIVRNSSVEAGFLHCGSQAVAFLPQRPRFQSDFWAFTALTPNQ
jgi:hypothetical protein